MNFIRTIEQLAENLDDSDPLEHVKIMKRIRIEAKEIAAFNTWSKQAYTRNCLARTDAYEIILLSWDINAKTAIHGHGGENCWVYQVAGTVVEQRYERQGDALKETKRLSLVPGKLTYMNDHMGYHSISNMSTQRAMTLHIYASPIDSCKVYNFQKTCFELKELSYHTFKGNEVTTAIY